MKSALLLLATVAACNGATLDVGSYDAGPQDAPRREAQADPPDTGGPSLAEISCPYIKDDAMYAALRGATCAGTCNESLTPARDVSGAAMLAASLTSAWTFCSGGLGPPGATGMRFYPGCVLFFLQASDGGVVGGVQSYDVVTSDAGVATGVVLHLASGDVEARVSMSSCLGVAELTTDAGVLKMASLGPSDANPAK